MQIFHGVVTSLIAVPGKTIEQRIQQMAGQGVALHHHGQGAVFDGVFRLPGVNAVQPMVQHFQTALYGVAQIHHVVCHAAKRVQGNGCIAYALGQQTAGCKKSLRSAAHHFDASGQVAVGLVSERQGHEVPPVLAFWLTSAHWARLHPVEYRRLPGINFECLRCGCAGETTRFA